MNLSDAKVLVTGGAKGLGLAIAIHLLKKGCNVTVVDLDQSAIDALPDQIQGFRVDVTDPRAVVDFFNQRNHDSIAPYEILINNAGIIHSEPMVNFFNPDSLVHSYANFRTCIDANLYSTFVTSSSMIESLITHRKKGVIINISSISARGNAGQTAYSAAKAGVNAMTIVWSKELAKQGIRCNAIAPGFIDTESTRSSLSQESINHIVKNNPMLRLGRPEEVAEAVESLIANDFINGVILDVNGGMTF